jgi:hypothetical protein
MGKLVNDIPIELIKWAIEYLEKNKGKHFSPNPYNKLDKLKLAIKNKTSKSQLTEEYLQKSNNLLKRLDELVKQGEELLEKRKKNGFKK